MQSKMSLLLDVGQKEESLEIGVSLGQNSEMAGKCLNVVIAMKRVTLRRIVLGERRNSKKS